MLPFLQTQSASERQKRRNQLLTSLNYSQKALLQNASIQEPTGNNQSADYSSQFAFKSYQDKSEEYVQNATSSKKRKDLRELLSKISVNDSKQINQVKKQFNSSGSVASPFSLNTASQTSHKRFISSSGTSPDSSKLAAKPTHTQTNSTFSEQFFVKMNQKEINTPKEQSFSLKSSLGQTISRRNMHPTEALLRQLHHKKFFSEKQKEIEKQSEKKERTMNQSQSKNTNYSMDLTPTQMKNLITEASQAPPLQFRTTWKSQQIRGNMSQTMFTSNSSMLSRKLSKEFSNTATSIPRDGSNLKIVISPISNASKDRKVHQLSFINASQDASEDECKIRQESGSSIKRVVTSQEEEGANSEIQMKKFIKLNPTILFQKEKLKKIQMLQQKQLAINKAIQQRNFSECVAQLRELLTLAANEKHLENFAETISLMGCLYQYNNERENAVYSFLQLKSLSEIVGNAKMKIKALILLGQFVQDESDYPLALILYRRAIQYSWYTNDVLEESDLYDKLGFVYFMQGDIEKAKYFHERSIQHLTEDPESENRQQNVFLIQKDFEDPEKCIPQLNQMVLAKLGLVTDQKGEMRFSTKISADLQIQMIREDKEFTLALHDPSKICPSFEKWNQIIPEGMEKEKEYQIIKKILNQKNSFQPVVLRNTQYKDPSAQRMVDYSILKIPIQEQINKLKNDIYDNTRLQTKLKQAQVSALINRQNKSQILFYNHCSPNRNILGFKYTFKPNAIKTQGYFKRMENMIMKSE